MTHDLHATLARSDLAAPGPRPDLAEPWAAGRRRRRGRRLAGTSAAVAVVGGLALGAVALSGPGTPSEVRSAGAPTSSAAAAPDLGSPPPAEPAAAAPSIAVEGTSGAPVEGRPQVAAEEAFAFRYGDDAGWQRDVAGTWQAWDGTGWTDQAVVVAWGTEQGGLVVGVDAAPVEQWLVPTSAPSYYLAPAASPGWYRVCVELVGPDDARSQRCVQVVVTSDGAPAAPEGSTPDGSTVPEVATPESGPWPDGFVPPEPATPEDLSLASALPAGPAPGEEPAPEAGVELRAVASSIPLEGSGGRAQTLPGSEFLVLVGGVPGWALDGGLRWQRWDGSAWAEATGDLSSAVGGPVVAADPPDPELTTWTYQVHQAEAALSPGWYRFCSDLVGPDDARVERCTQLVVAEP